MLSWGGYRGLPKLPCGLRFVAFVGFFFWGGIGPVPPHIYQLNCKASFRHTLKHQCKPYNRAALSPSESEILSKNPQNQTTIFCQTRMCHNGSSCVPWEEDPLGQDLKAWH